MGPGLASRNEVESLSVLALTREALMLGTCSIALSRHTDLSLSTALIIMALEVPLVLPSPSPDVSEARMVGTSSPR